MQNRTTGIPSALLRRTSRRATILLLPALLLAGCGSNSSSNADLEARIAAVEKKAEEAEIRSKEALSMAASAGSSANAPVVEPEEFTEDTIQAEDPYGTAPGPGPQMVGPPQQNMQMMPGQ